MQDLVDIGNSPQRGEGFNIYDNDDNRDYVCDQLTRLSDAIELWAKDHDPQFAYDGPMYNSGYRFANDVFIAVAYDWTDYESNVNFYHFDTGIDISWYKHVRRGTWGHGEATELAIITRTLEDIVDECIASLDDTAENQFVFELSE